MTAPALALCENGCGEPVCPASALAERDECQECEDGRSGCPALSCDAKTGDHQCPGSTYCDDHHREYCGDRDCWFDPDRDRD